MVVIITVIVLALTFGVYFVPKPNQSVAPGKPAQQNTAATDLGITYLPLTPGVAAYYDLGVDSGALITQIDSKSLAARAGLKVGDVILNYNGSPVEKGTSLLSVVRDCPVGANIVMEVSRGKISQTVSFIHTKN
ncbi:MAG: PDZ domain-containing protein [Dehalococcoidales bacterium]|nr:PDZ domain-containing protein [Dehalococcoidales bacterium]